MKKGERERDEKGRERDQLKKGSQLQVKYVLLFVVPLISGLRR